VIIASRAVGERPKKTGRAKSHFSGRRLTYFHIVRILAFTSTGARVALLVSSFDFICGQDRL